MININVYTVRISDGLDCTRKMHYKKSKLQRIFVKTHENKKENGQN